jgi:hypothetical protein
LDAKRREQVPKSAKFKRVSAASSSFRWGASRGGGRRTPWKSFIELRNHPEIGDAKAQRETDSAGDIAFLGPAPSSHLPNAAAETPSFTIASEKIHAICVCYQPLGAELVYSKKLRQRNLEHVECVDLADAEMDDGAAGGTSHRPNPGCAMDSSRSRKDMTALSKVPRYGIEQEF